MRAELAAVVILVVAAAGAARVLDAKAPAGSEAAEVEAARAPASLAAARPSLSSAYGADEEVRIAAGPDHQFYVTAAVNNAPSSFLVDTGAGYVALRDTDARRAGIYTSWADFIHPVRTANGETKAAVIVIEAIEIGALRVENVKAFILPDEQLGVNLLGMTFLSRLESVEARAGVLVLRG